ncbi:hypothetical protein [Thiothrix subterranea]|uniref:hypothetical protein n=1 Tax=Thiothrix subterranea TaxID=2735563 RepID=UPI00280A5837|nr:hypothetical protein [Thiothrix subterranea]
MRITPSLPTLALLLALACFSADVLAASPDTHAGKRLPAVMGYRWNCSRPLPMSSPATAHG